MRIFGANISQQASDFLNDSLENIISFEKANQTIYGAFGILNFFDNDEELTLLKETLSISNYIVEEPDRAEYGDFQTNHDLANKVVLLMAYKRISPEVIIEPTCGKGNFIVASLCNFNNIKKIYGVEIYKPYVWEAKFSIIDFFLSNPTQNKPDISIAHCNVFDYNFKAIALSHSTNDILVIGNPPWVTNSKLGSLNSNNLPKKSNFKNHGGLDAMTGKGNFDIAEFITLSMIKTFHHLKGNLVLLVKNSVIKNIVFDQNKNKYKIGSVEKYRIDSKKEFDVSVEAALFFCSFNSIPAFDCNEFDFYNSNIYKLKFGWLNDKFVSNIANYIHTKEIDGRCPLVWRQGLKHDCSTIMELDKINGLYINGLNEEVKLEDGLVYGILKSSDLKKTVLNKTRKFTIVTQKKVGQETGYIKTEYPKTYQYLLQHKTIFEARKSSIYKNKPLFSIFGIGEYSFKKYKVAISGLYKTFRFTLILPQNSKPIMLDDTCYLLGFDRIEFAVYTLILLNSEKTVHFLQSITFPDSKRTFTKEVLMRIDLYALSNLYDTSELKKELEKLNEKYELNLTLDLWADFISVISPVNTGQLVMFE